MGRFREDSSTNINGGGRWRGRRSNRSLLVMLLIFAVVVGITTVINMHTPLGYNQASIAETLYQNENPQDTRKALQQAEDEKKVVHPYTPIQPDAKSSSGWLRTWQTLLPGVMNDETFSCERSHIRTDVCRMHGIVQLVGNDTFVLNAVDERTLVGNEKLKPYTRKWETLCMDKVSEVTLQSEIGAQGKSSQACEVRHHVPAVVFSTGGYTGNVYHEFHDGLIPLYITTQHLKGEVIFIVVDYHSWWVLRYQEILRQLSKYEVMDIANYTRSHCFSDVTAGLFIHDELGIDNSLMPKHESIKDFRALLSQAYQKEEHGWQKDFQSFGSRVSAESTESSTVPQLVIINREGNRAIVNVDEVIEMATGAGFNVTILQPEPTTEMKKIFWLLDRCDVLIGVHGAALTHFLFMRPGSIFIQIVPLGTDWAARTYYGDPAIRLGLHYFEYKITVDESSLSKEYAKTDPVLINPNAVGQLGWSVIKEIYLSKQSVELSLPRFSKTLQEARAKWKADPAPPRQSVSRKRSYKKHRRRESFEDSLDFQVPRSN